MGVSGSSLSSPRRPQSLRDAPRSIDVATRVAVLLKGEPVWMACLMILAGLLMGVDELRQTGAVALAFDGDEVPGVIETVVPRRRSSKGSTGSSWRITASASVGGARVMAHGTLRAQGAAGEPVTVFVPRRRPDLAVAYRGSGPPREGVLPYAIAGLAGVGVLVVALHRNARDLRVLRHGRVSAGKIVEKTQRTHRRGVSWTLVFSYPTTAGPRRTTVKVENAEAERLVDEEREPLVYDPRAPSYAVLLDALPDRVRVDDHGALTPVPWQRGLVRALPIVAVLLALAWGLLATGLV
jgi:hypothetical protein